MFAFCRFVFEDQISFIKESVMAGENVLPISVKPDETLYNM